MVAFLPSPVETFLRTHVAREDAHLRRIRDAVDRQGLPRITPEAGRTLSFLVGAFGVKRGVEIGTCLGYSALWIARGLPKGGRLESLDLDPERSAQAGAFLKRAGVEKSVILRVADAHADLRHRKSGSVDFVFIDAEKEGMPAYLKESVRVLRKGGLLAADNVFWKGSAFDERDTSEGATAVRAFNQAALHHPRLDATVLPLGDGLLVARRR